MLDKNFTLMSRLKRFLASTERIKSIFPYLELLELPGPFLIMACIIKKRQLCNENFRWLKLTT